MFCIEYHGALYLDDLSADARECPIQDLRPSRSSCLITECLEQCLCWWCREFRNRLSTLSEPSDRKKETSVCFLCIWISLWYDMYSTMFIYLHTPHNMRLINIVYLRSATYIGSSHKYEYAALWVHRYVTYDKSECGDFEVRTACYF